MRIDWSIPHQDEHGNLNDYAGTLEHKIPLTKAPHLAEDPGNLAASHSLCNRSHGNRDEKPGIGVITQTF